MDQPHSRRMGSRTWPWRGFAGGRFRFRFAIERSAKVKDLHVLERFWHTWHASASPVHGEFIIYSPLCWESGCLASEAIWRRSFEEMLRWSNAAIQIPILKKWALNNSAGIHGSAKRANVFHTHTHTRNAKVGIVILRLFDLCSQVPLHFFDLHCGNVHGWPSKGRQINQVYI